MCSRTLVLKPAQGLKSGRNVVGVWLEQATLTATLSSLESFERSCTTLSCLEEKLQVKLERFFTITCLLHSS